MALTLQQTEDMQQEAVEVGMNDVNPNRVRGTGANFVAIEAMDKYHIEKVSSPSLAIQFLTHCAHGYML